MAEYSIPVSNDLIDELERSISRGVMEIHPNGSFSITGQKVLVGRIDGLKVEIFANDHPPPHFRVKLQGSTANFRISDGGCINGSGEVMRYQGNIARWHQTNKQKLIDTWNRMRPTDCSVGEYRE